MTDTIPTLIVGAGYVGTALAQHLRPQHHNVTALVSSQSSQQALLKSGFDAQRTDLDESLHLPTNSPKITNVVYLVPPARTSLRDTRLDNFLQHAPEQIAKLVYISTSGVYGDRQGEVCTEQAKPAPQTDRARRRLDAERQIQKYCADKNIPWLILRVPGIYGPGRLPLESIRAQKPIIQVSEAAPGNRIHRDDLAQIIAYALSTPQMQGVVNVGDGNHMSTSAFTLNVAQIAGLQPPPQISREQMHQVASSKRLSFLNESRILDTGKLQNLLPQPLTFANPLDGIRHALKIEPDQG